MNIINMVDDFQLMCKEIKDIGNFQAYKSYTMKYPELFEGVFKKLYMTDIDNLKDLINYVDFYENLKIVKSNENHGIIEKVIKEAEKVAALLNFTEDFDLYLGMELGNIGGFSVPNNKTKPYIYIGLDRHIDDLFIKYLIPHEMNHMVRINAIQDINSFDFMERVISEGLGSLCAIALYKMEYSEENLCKALSLPIEDVRKLNLEKDSLIDKLTGEFGTPLTQNKMKQYFSWSEKEENLHLSGYYVGMEIVKKLVDEGYDFANLTVMPSQLIFKEYNTVKLNKC